MSYEIRTPGGGFLTINDVDFNCPKCGHLHLEADYQKKLEKSGADCIHINCKNNQCGVKLGVTTDMKGDVRFWLKSEAKVLIPKIQTI